MIPARLSKARSVLDYYAAGAAAVEALNGVDRSHGVTANRGLPLAAMAERGTSAAVKAEHQIGIPKNIRGEQRTTPVPKPGQAPISSTRPWASIAGRRLPPLASGQV